MKGICIVLILMTVYNVYPLSQTVDKLLYDSLNHKNLEKVNAPPYDFSILGNDYSSYREELIDLRISGINDSYIQFRNNTISDGQFEPTIHGRTISTGIHGLAIMGNILDFNDTEDKPIISIASYVDNGLGWKNGG